MRRMLLNSRIMLAALVVGTLLAVALWPRAVLVDAATATRGPLVVTIDEEGVTRVRERFVVSSPVFGRVMRIALEPGDAVTQGRPVALLRAQAPPLLDERERADAQAAVEGARAALGRARAEDARARATLAQLQRDLTRIRELAASRVVSAQELDTREAQRTAAAEAVNAAAFAAQAAEFDLQRAQARLMPAAAGTGGRVVTVNSPVTGVVLKRLRESESIVAGGDPLLEVADPMRLEIVADLLSTDAVRVKPGARAVLEEWGGARELPAIVRRVEPAGFTKISALGVEEQRVNVILDFANPSDACAELGDAYRVEVRIVIWEGQVVKIPTSAMFRSGRQWSVYRLVENRARLTPVTIGHQTGQEAEVTAGVAAGDRVIVHPGDTLADGARARAR